jgi:ribosomal protein S18 acetylase RimI-like enzyme
MHIQILPMRSTDDLLRLTGYDNLGKITDRLTFLMRELSSGSPKVSTEQLRTFFAHGGVLILALDTDDHIFGMGSLVFSYKINDITARIEHVVRDPIARGEGIGRSLLKALIDYSTIHQVRYVDLTTEPERIEANKLYLEFGFVIRRTNAMRLRIRT